MGDRKYNKNKYYLDDDIKKSIQLADRFYKKTYSPKLLKNGNTKLGSNVVIFDLPAIVTCKYKCKDCYAVKAERMYRNTRVMRAFHYDIVKQALKDVDKKKYLIGYINAELRYHAMLYRLPVVRIHASGDMFCLDYLRLWLDIIQQNKDINFYTYSKILSDKDIDYYNSLYNNFNIVKSLIDGKINYGDIDYINSIAKTLEADNIPYKICGYGIDDNEKCMGNCTACLYCSNILFKKH